MSYSTDLWCCISFLRKTYKTKEDVQEDLDEARSSIRAAKETITKLVYMTEPNKFFKARCGESVLDIVAEELQSAFDSLEEAYCNENRLSILLDEWDNCHDSEGKSIQPPDGIDCMTAFISGDYIK